MTVKFSKLTPSITAASLPLLSFLFLEPPRPVCVDGMFLNVYKFLGWSINQLDWMKVERWKDRCRKVGVACRLFVVLCSKLTDRVRKMPFGIPHAPQPLPCKNFAGRKVLRVVSEWTLRVCGQVLLVAHKNLDALRVDDLLRNVKSRWLWSSCFVRLALEWEFRRSKSSWHIFFRCCEDRYENENPKRMTGILLAFFSFTRVLTHEWKIDWFRLFFCIQKEWKNDSKGRVSISFCLQYLLVSIIPKQSN